MLEGDGYREVGAVGRASGSWGWHRGGWWGVALLGLMLGCGVARASVSVLLEEPYGGLGRYNPTGHTAIYLDHVCAETPTRLRPCRPGELGVVISRYDGMGGLDWVAVPLVPYLYAVERAEDVPERVDRPDVVRLREAYRRAHLMGIAPDGPDGQSAAANWYELVGSAYDRKLYVFQVESTAEQDARLIARMNDLPNRERYNGAFRNCADFAREILDRYYYPGSVRRNFVADFGLTTPKSVARALDHYAKKHPGTGLQVYRIPQVPGGIARSHAPEGVTESLLKKYGIPLFLLSPDTTVAVAAAYVGRGRFSMPKRAPVMDVRLLSAEAATAAEAPVEAPWPGADEGGAMGLPAFLVGPTYDPAPVGPF